MSRRTLLLISLCWLVTSCREATEETKQPQRTVASKPRILSHVQASTVRIVCGLKRPEEEIFFRSPEGKDLFRSPEAKEGKEKAGSHSISTGWGVAVGPAGHFLTAYHVVDGPDPRIVYWQNDRWFARKLQIVRYDAALDVALVKAQVYRKPVPFHPDPAWYRGTVYTTDGERLYRSQLHYKRIQHSDGDGLESVALLSSLEGESGSPVFAEDGSLLGVLCSTGTLVEETSERRRSLATTGFVLPSWYRQIGAGTLPASEDVPNNSLHRTR